MIKQIALPNRIDTHWQKKLPGFFFSGCEGFKQIIHLCRHPIQIMPVKEVPHTYIFPFSKWQQRRFQIVVENTFLCRFAEVPSEAPSSATPLNL